MTPRISSPLSLSTFKNRFSTKRARLTLGAAAAAVAVAGVAIGAAASPTPAALPAALNHAGVAKVTPATRTPLFHPAQAPVGGATKQAHRTVHVKLALDKHADANRPASGAAAHHAATRPGAPKPGHENRGRHPFGRHHGHLRHHRAVFVSHAPYLIYDSTTPTAIPAHHVAAAYATGNYAASPSQLTGKGPIVWIDTTGNDPAASALDVEPGDATPTVAANWAFHRLSERPHAVARIYTMRSEWGAVQSAVAGLPHKMQSRIRWWIADPTGVPHIVPGSAATQWYWGSSYDITTATPRF